MNLAFESESVGTKLGSEGVEHIVELAGNYVECERRRIESSRRADIVECKARLCFLQERETSLKERIRQMPPPGDVRTRRRRFIYYASVAAVLTFAGFFFALLAFDPFRFGWKSYLYCLAIAVVAPFAVDKFLDLWKSERVLRALAAITLVAALASLVLLALIRGEILLQQLQAMDSVVVSGLENATSQHNPANFYTQTLGWLRLTMALLAIAMEIGAGLALHDAWRYGSNLDDDSGQLQRQLEAVQREMTVCVRRIADLESLSEQFVYGFWADFFRAVLEGTTRHAVTKGIATLALLVMLCPAVRAADPGVNLVVALDLSRSLQVTNPAGKSEHHQNLAAVESLLSTLPAGARVTIIGITDQSLTRPYILMSAQVAADPGYFNERLAAARKQLVQAWATISKDMRPTYEHTDIFGALLLANRLFDETPTMRKVLVVLSDSRHEGLGINLEKPESINSAEVMTQVERAGLIADLKGVEVHVVGTVAPGKTAPYWRSLRDFWRLYFRKTGTTLASFSVTRDLPNFNQRQPRASEKIDDQLNR